LMVFIATIFIIRCRCHYLKKRNIRDMEMHIKKNDKKNIEHFAESPNFMLL